MEDGLRQRIEAASGRRVTALMPLSGGCVGDVFLARMADGPDLVAKVGEPGSGLALEGRMLAYLAAHAPLPVPQVLHADDALLLMTRLESNGGLDANAQRHGAELVAALHGVTTGHGFGFAYDTVIGGLRQPNPWTPKWRDFFAEQRLLYMSREAERAGRLSARVLTRIEKLAGALDKWIEEPAQPSLVHGDMWGGNVLAASGRISGFIDPAIYFADPEIELAFTTLFGTFGDDFFSRYHELRPIRPGFFEARRDLYNLYPLLVHVRLFGGSYVAAVERTLSRFGV